MQTLKLTDSTRARIVVTGSEIIADWLNTDSFWSFLFRSQLSSMKFRDTIWCGSHEETFFSINQVNFILCMHFTAQQQRVHVADFFSSINYIYLSNYVCLIFLRLQPTIKVVQNYFLCCGQTLLSNKTHIFFLSVKQVARSHVSLDKSSWISSVFWII